MMKQQYIAHFTELTGGDLWRVGGKGANLGEMSGAGFPVPEGFCVTTAAFQTFMDSCPQKDELYGWLADLPADDVEAVRVVGQKIRHILGQLALPAEVETELFAAWQSLGEQHSYAVRSSATAEDLPSASFAGQQDTYLNVRGAEMLREKVRDCWVSLFTDRAILYRQQNQFDHHQVALSVVVQRMVQPQVSGIMFTADPITGHRHLVAIDASFGLGEALVSGLVSADLYQVDKRTKVIVKQQIGDKQLAIYSRPEGGVERVELTGEERTRASLTPTQLVALAELGTKIESHYKQPQDIEWCIENEQIYIVQSRPITSLYPLPKPLPTDEAIHLYLSFGHIQVMTDPMHVMAQSIFQTALPFGRNGKWLNPYIKAAGGRLFIELTPLLRHPVTRRMALAFLPLVDPLIAQAMAEVSQRPAFLAQGERAQLMDVVRFMAPLWQRVITTFWSGQPEKAVQKVAEIGQALVQRVQNNVQQAPAGKARLEAVRHELYGMFMPFIRQLLPEIVPGMLGLGLLTRFTKSFARPGELAAVGRGLVGNVTTEMDMAVGDLADAARSCPALVAHLGRTDLSAAELIQTAAQIPGSEPFCQAWQQFMALYGMRGPSEIDISRNRWAEDPTPLLQVVVGNLQHGEPGKHRLHHQQLKQEGEAALERLTQGANFGFWGSWRSRWVQRLGRNFRGRMAVREHPKYFLIQILWLFKQAILEAGGLLVAAGRLDRPEDVWHFTIHELTDYFDQSTVDLRPLVAQRQAEKERFAHLTPPRVLTSEGEAVVVAYKPANLPAGALMGNPVSAGVVEGIAHVVIDPHKEVLSPGEILVAPFTDPGWTPLFINAAGVVIEVGGLMTHGSVVAREYGIPAVVGVLEATKKIKTGQRIRVHGEAGYVEFLEEVLSAE